MATPLHETSLLSGVKLQAKQSSTNSKGHIMSENKIRSWGESFELYRTWILAGNDPISTNDEILNEWLSTQRLRRSGKKPRQTLTPERENKLTELGMVWDVRDHKYRQYILECEKYYKQFGNLDVPAKYISNGLRLGNWIQRRRKAYQNHREGLSGKGVLKITEAQIRELEALGMVWSSNRQSAKSFPEYALLHITKRYFQDAKTLTRHNSPCKMELDIFIKSLGKGIEYDGVYWHKNKYKEDCIKTDTYRKNGIDLIRIRESGLPKIPNCQNIMRKVNNSDDDLYEAILKALQLLGITDIERNAGSSFNELLSDYLKRSDDEWRDVLNEAVAVASRKGKQLVISKYHRSKKGFSLAAWLNTQRSMYRKGRLSTKRQKMLINAGFSLRPSDAIENEHIEAIDELIAEYGSIDGASDSEKNAKFENVSTDKESSIEKTQTNMTPL